MLWVAESNDKTYYIAVGIKSASDVKYVDMWIGKYQASDGALVWEMTQSAETASTNAGLESVAFTSDGGFVVSGFTNSALGIDDMGFKSGGQIDEGLPFFGKISASDAASSSAPSSWEWSYDTLTDDLYTGSAKAVRIDSSDNVYGLVGSGSWLVKLTSTGTKDWDTGTNLKDYGQMNDLEIVTDGIVMTGHSYGTTNENCWGSGCGVIKGSMVKVDTSGTFSWQKDHGNYAGGVNQFAGLEVGHWGLIYTECWGIAPQYDTDLTTQNGFVLSCGTGIEGCNGAWIRGLPSLIAECYSDPRTVWRSLTIGTDLNGDRTWSRMDSFQSGEGDVTSSAAEYVVNTADGGSMSITDEAYGIGFAVYKPYTNTACTATYALNDSAL